MALFPQPPVFRGIPRAKGGLLGTASTYRLQFTNRCRCTFQSQYPALPPLGLTQPSSSSVTTTMSSTVNVCINDENKPANIPSYETIITQSFALRPGQNTAINTGGVRITLDKRSHTEVSDIWVKFGSDITVGEAKTQRFVAQHLESNNIAAVRAPRIYLAFTCGRFVFIVTEYIDGRICGDSDIPFVAATVQDLITIQSLSSTPGHVGGGLIEHPFFVYGTIPSRSYKLVLTM